MSSLRRLIRGHNSIFTFWSDLLDQTTLEQPGSGTFLLTGPEGVGKKSAAWAMIQEAFCERLRTPRESCGVCASCLRVMGHHHESVLWISPENNVIKIDQARQVLEFLSLMSLQEFRFVVIESVELMNPQAANALLKILEEPPVGTYFFLLSSNPMGLLPTIRSRVKILRFKPLSADDLRGSRSLPDWIVQASRGSFARLKRLADSETQEVRKEAGELLLKILISKDFLTDDSWRSGLKDKEKWRTLVALFIEILRDTICIQLGAKDLLTTPDLSSVLVKLKDCETEMLHQWLSAVIQLEKEISTPRDTQLVLEQFYIENQS